MLPIIASATQFMALSPVYEASGAPHKPARQLWKYMAVFTLAMGLYANTFTHDYAWDDYAVILNNQYTQKGWEAVPDIFTQKVYLQGRNVYRPLTQLGFAAEVALFGNNALVSHIANVLLYAFCCVVLLALLQLLFGAVAEWVPLSAVLLFTVLPVHTEAVANIKSRDEVQMLLFGLSALYFWALAVKNSSWLQAGLALLLFTASELSKENAITLLAVAPLMAHYLHPNAKGWVMLQWRTNRARLLLLLMAAGAMLALGVSLQLQALATYNITLLLLVWVAGSLWYGADMWQKVKPLTLTLVLLGVVTLLIWKAGWLTPVIETGQTNVANTIPPAKTNVPIEPLNNVLKGAASLDEKLATMLLIMGKYLQLAAVPVVLVYHYGYNQLPLTNFTDYRVWLSLLLHLGLLWYAIRGLRRKSIIGFGVLFYLITLSVYTHITILLPEVMRLPLGSNLLLKIEAGLYNVLPDTLAERFLLLPSVGFCLALAYGLGWLTGKTSSSSQHPDSLNTGAFALVMGLLLLAYGTKTVFRNAVWKNNQTLFSADLENMPDNAMAHVFYGQLWLDQMQAAKTPQQAAESFKRFEAAQLRALQIYPRFLSANLKLASVYLSINQPQKALPFLENNLNWFPQEPAAYFGMGQYYYEQERYQEAMAYFEKTLYLEPYYAEAYRFLAWCYVNSGCFEDAIGLLEDGAKLFPDKPHFFTLVCHLQVTNGMYDKAAESCKRALSLQPNDAQVLENLIKALEATGQTDAAQQYRNQLKTGR
ncbi:hypothetical protein BVG80_15715 [Sphingobacteriales bacterium TSM_CSM]|nr:hypothetical protein BVG80_15715 [Sphingobacteriales bacterium TSM_CSM]